MYFKSEGKQSFIKSTPYAPGATWYVVLFRLPCLQRNSAAKLVFSWYLLPVF
jgi:hypothetical protein